MSRDLRYPIGRFTPPADVSRDQVDAWIDDLARLPADLRRVARSLGPEQLEAPYRPGGWSVRQVIHHLVDSHLNSFIRFKWALTEDRPRIKAYLEDRWAALPDYRDTPIATSLRLLESLHERWVHLLRGLGAEELRREFIHPETEEAVRLDVNIGLYAWHGRHHLAHITHLAEREGWAID